jgi:hypothetical protein
MRSSRESSDAVTKNGESLATRSTLQPMPTWGFAPFNSTASVQLVPLTDREQSWRLARRGRFRVNGVRVWQVATLP